MESGRRSAAFLFLALALATSSIGTVAAHLDLPAGKHYMLISLQTTSGGRAKLAVKTGVGDMSIPGFANKKQQWLAVTGSEDLVKPGSNSYRRRDVTGGLGFFSLLVGTLVNGGTCS